MDHVRRAVSDSFNEAWQTLKKKAVAVVIAMLLPAIYDVLSCVRVCDELPAVPHGELECNGNVIGSVCTVKCDELRKVEGSSRMVCGEDRKWSTTAPSCVCSNPCRIGEKCDKFLSWQEFKHYINDDGGTSFPNFGGHPIKCSTHHKIQGFKLKWVCKCIDITTGHEVKCKGYDSRYGSCEHSSAELIRQMVVRNIYPKPCDPDSLMTGC